VILPNVIKYWEEIINECSSEEDYLFTRGLEPSLIPIQPYQITKRWKRLVKDKYNVTADFYALKHLFWMSWIKPLVKAIYQRNGQP
jgi:hypothetical protein